MTKLTWEDIDSLAKDMLKGLSKKYKYVYGVPRGGVYVAMMVACLLSKNRKIMMLESLEHAPREEVLVVDDIIDLGVTRNDYRGYHFLALTKRDGDWIEFPWERMNQEAPDPKFRSKEGI